MLSNFYKQRSKQVLWLVALSFPLLYITAESLPSNNDLETWLPRESAVRQQYDSFKERFGAEEVVVIGMSQDEYNPQLAESLCSRLERLEGVRRCWSPERLTEVMRELGVSEEAIPARLEGLAVSSDGNLVGIVALLSDTGLGNRAQLVENIREELRYCQLDGDRSHMAGAPVVVAELDRLGGAESNRKFFLVTLLICLVLLYYTIRDWRLTFSILGLTIWAIQATMATICLAGGQMNFVLDALPVMVMVFTLAIAVHLLNYFHESARCKDPLGEALGQAWKPCCLATLTTCIGLISLTISDIGPVCQFGYAAALGAFVALVTGLGLTPALLTVWPPEERPQTLVTGLFERAGHFMLSRAGRVALVSMSLFSFTGAGLFWLDSKIDPLDFLPQNGKVLSDVRCIQQELANTDSVEAVIDFGQSDLPFVAKLKEVRRIESLIGQHPQVQHTMSLASFFPETMPDSALETTQLLQRARSRQGDNDYVAAGERLWRVSARIYPGSKEAQQNVFEELVELTRDEPVSLTGISPMLAKAQQEIFNGFWESFTTAFGIITLVMMLSLKSFGSGAVAMIPNLAPICIVYGTLGWIGFPVDIGMMMAGSIALGIAVDGTFHYLVHYQAEYRATRDSAQASHAALSHTGLPILQASVIASAGMLALTMSSFGPTARFGLLMATLLAAALVGDLVLLPSLLALRPERKQRRAALSQGPHFTETHQQRHAHSEQTARGRKS